MFIDTNNNGKYDVEALGVAHGTTAAYYAHASAGCLHIRPLVNLKTVEGVQTMSDMAYAAAGLPAEESATLEAALEAGLTGYTYLDDAPL